MPGVPRALKSARSRRLAMKLHETLVANEAQDAIYVVDLRAIAKKHQKWVEHLPRVQPYYAFKCNNDKRVAQTLVSLGASFDCASTNEIKDVLSVGAKADQIVYANPIKQATQLQAARELGVDFTVVDNDLELDKIAAHHPKSRILIRVATDDEASSCRFSEKFGADLSAVPRLLERGKKLGLNIVGVSYHVGSGCYDVATYTAAVRNARLVFDIAHSRGIHMHVLDIGGGFPGVDRNITGYGGGDFAWDFGAGEPKHGATFPEIAQALNAALDIFFPPDPIKALTQGKDLHVMAEPGRYFVEGSHTLAVNIIGKRARQETDTLFAKLQPASRIKYYLNDGLYSSFNNVIYDHATVAPVPLRAELLKRGPEAVASYMTRVLPLFANTPHPTDPASHNPASMSTSNITTNLQMGNVPTYVSGHPAALEPSVFPYAPVNDAVAPPVTRLPVDQVMDPPDTDEEELPPPVPVSVLSTPFGRALAYSQATGETIHRSSMWGQTCDGFDVITPDIHLPDLDIGDWLVFEDMGAYTVAGACAFNGFELPKKVYIEHDEEWDMLER